MATPRFIHLRVRSAYSLLEGAIKAGKVPTLAADAGMPPSLDWELPNEWTAGPLRFPVPERFETPPLASFGYKDFIPDFTGAQFDPAAWADLGPVGGLGTLGNVDRIRCAGPAARAGPGCPEGSAEGRSQGATLLPRDRAAHPHRRLGPE